MYNFFSGFFMVFITCKFKLYVYNQYWKIFFHSDNARLQCELKYVPENTNICKSIWSIFSKASQRQRDSEELEGPSPPSGVILESETVFPAANSWRIISFTYRRENGIGTQGCLELATLWRLMAQSSVRPLLVQTPTAGSEGPKLPSGFRIL